MRRAALLPFALLAASACGAEPTPRAPIPTAPAPAPVMSASATAPEPVASAVAAAPPRPCPPRPAYAPVSFVTGRTERRGKDFNVFIGAPQLATQNPDLAPSLHDVQAAIDGWMQRKTDFCKGGTRTPCSGYAYCDITRNDGEHLAFLCTGLLWAQGSMDEVQHEALLFRRRGARFEPLSRADLARDRASDLRLTLFPAEAPDVAQSSYLALRDDAFELSRDWIHLPPPAVARSFVRYAEAAPRLVCDTALDLPEAPREGATVEPGPLVVATHVTGSDGDENVIVGDELSAGFTYPRFIAHAPDQAEAARLLNEAAARYIGSHRKLKSYSGITCRVYTSTPRLVSMLCGGEELTADVAPAAENLVLGNPPRRIGAAQLFAHRPSAPKEIARRCFARYLPGPHRTGLPALAKVPDLRADDLESFSLWQTGAMFAIPFELDGGRHVELCFVPNQVLGTSAEMIARSGGK
ncbi:Hypothetical protein A7982_02391 [Minicystis rosea]|nr:Hypothetical protein A7982_02391 [Minicystis rosea]